MIEKLSFECPNCSRILRFRRYNARFGDQGYMYCDIDSTLLVWSSYDPIYSSLTSRTHPWMLDEGQQLRIEGEVIDCPSGGHFKFAAKPRCPYCNYELPLLSQDPAYYVILGNLIDGELVDIWKNAAEQSP
jgi:hypothetical protein